jgi:hypothetical protein
MEPVFKQFLMFIGHVFERFIELRQIAMFQTMGEESAT